MVDHAGPNDPSGKEKAEGSREHAEANEANGADNPMERGPGQVSQPEKPIPPTGDAIQGNVHDITPRRPSGEQHEPQEGPGTADGPKTGGITNRPLAEERQQQEALPPRSASRAEE